MTSLGETLRRERLKRNLELGQIAEELKISSRFLEAIEAGQLDKLPGGVFTKSFIVQYARLLGLDEEQIAGEVQRMLEPPPPVVPEFVETPKPADSGMRVPRVRVPRVEEWQAVSGGSRFRWSSSLFAAALVVVVMLVCSVLYTWWQRTRHPAAAHESPSVAAVQPPPQTPPVQPSQQPPAPSTAAPGETAPAQPAAQNPPAQPVSGASAPAPSTERPAPPATPPAQPPAPVASASESNPNAPVRVEVTADEPVWVLARSDGKYIFSGTLGANQSRTIDANSIVVLRLGNAGGVTITLNGKSIGPVGPKGQVRTVQLTSGGFQIVAVPKSPVPLDPL